MRTARNHVPNCINAIMVCEGIHFTGVSCRATKQACT